MAKAKVKIYVVYRWFVSDPQTNKELSYIGYAHIAPTAESWLRGVQVSNMEFYTHKRKNKSPVSSNTKFAKAINKYGPQAFKYEILEIVATQKEALKKKGDWIDHYNSQWEGFNTGRGGGSRLRICQYDLNNLYIADYDSCKEASKAANIPSLVISYCLTGKIKSVNGFIFKYRDK